MITYRNILPEEIKIQKDNGYQYFTDYNHPLAIGNSGKVYYHRHVASIKYGHWLTSDEHVHHIDGIKTNNIPTNLEVLSNVEHGLLHSGGPVYKPCLYCNKEFGSRPSDNQKFCSIACCNLHKVKNSNITKEYLNVLIPEHSWVSLGRLFGYSDNGIKKRAKSLGCDLTKIKTACRSGPKD